MVVIKVYMKRRLRLQPYNEREAFLQGAQSLYQLKHPHLLSVIDVGFRDGWPYVIMEHAIGGSLRQRLKSANTGGTAYKRNLETY